MNTFERRNLIIKLLKENGTVLVSDLSQQFDISEVSIRTDLRLLEKQGLLIRFHGGAGLLNTPQSEDTETKLEERYSLSQNPKNQIAYAAAKLIKEGNTIILDSGSTTMMIAHQLLKIKNITVITNNLPAATILSDSPDITLVLCGGTVRHKTRSMHGTMAENALQGIRADIMFVGADGVDPHIGLTTFNEGYHISSVMASVSSKVVAVVDSTKFNRNGFNVVLPMNKLDLIITDRDLSPQHKAALAGLNLSLKIA
ncbi:DeoR/GlpR family DNA-binding transcription regulator [Lonepinella koalarum]|uniref:DeoR family transcriptional regulator n=1 Tax=Lonepinella koalarum TaxID=53417 RepID=A0A4R1L338_9PAST|nr:DeoR/GlpR family DNA-binding transcription regulator [Lonepinella koalarum]MDH2926731.1 transcriptional regulator [Lonepinella koalarum]TCK70609.1 DeoR family transcriptional regulator [Lonepinella koalarum]TFJ90010.1 DeoR/GlpR transcriptional regulator [Lonepinella koalarum]